MLKPNPLEVLRRKGNKMTWDIIPTPSTPSPIGLEGVFFNPPGFCHAF